MWFNIFSLYLWFHEEALPITTELVGETIELLKRFVPLCSSSSSSSSSAWLASSWDMWYLREIGRHTQTVGAGHEESCSPVARCCHSSTVSTSSTTRHEEGQRLAECEHFVLLPRVIVRVGGGWGVL